jgi:hypothetical protein
MAASAAVGIVGVVMAVLIGGAAGWLLARRERDRAVAAAREVATAGTFQLADDLYARTKRATELESKLGAVRAQVGALKDAVAAADERAHLLEAEAESRAHALEGERAGLAARVAALVAESAASAADLARRQQELDRLAALVGTRDDEIAALRAQLKALEAASQAIGREPKREAAGAAAVPPPSSRARRAARLPEDPRPAQHEPAADGSNRDALKLKRPRKESRKKYGTEP